MDRDVAGAFFLNAFYNSQPGNITLNWIFKQNYQSPMSIVHDVERGEVWAAVYMRSQVTSLINQIIDTTLQGSLLNSSNYVSSSAVTIIFDEVRSVNAVRGFILPAIEAAVANASSTYATFLQSRIQSSSNVTLGSLLDTISIAPILFSPIDYTTMNLHPASPYARWLSTNLGYLFLWLLMTALVAVNIRITTPFLHKVKLIDIILVRIVSTIVNSFIISLIFSLCILWFGNFHTADLFIRHWFFNWLFALTFASIIALFTVHLEVKAQLFLTLFIILNLSASGSSLPVELQSQFHRIGYGLPFYHCLSGGRHLLFGSYANLALDVGVLLVYYTVCITVLMITGMTRMHHQQQRTPAHPEPSAAATHLSEKE